MKHKLRFEPWMFGILALILFQIFTLNRPSLNGDEAMYTLILSQLAQMRAGVAPMLNPIIGYTGPLDFWLLVSVYAVSHFLGLEAAPWMVRIIPLTLFWLGLWFLYKE